MIENDDDGDLSDGAQRVLSIFKSEPIPAASKTINPRLADDLENVVNDAIDYSYANMKWLDGVYIDREQLYKVRSIIGKIREALESGAGFENSFWEGAKQSQDARNDFVKALFKGVETGHVKLS